MSTFSGDQIAQVNNPDPFAVPVWRAPVYHTPGWVITVVQLARVIKTLIAFLVRHPLATLIAVAAALAWYRFGWPGPVTLTASITALLAAWWWRWRASFRRHITGRVRGKWRRWHYQRHWLAVMTIGRLASVYQGRLLLPVLGKVTSTPYTDRVLTGIVSGQSADDFARRAEALAHGFGALLCRVRTARPGWLVLEFVRRDALAAIIPALPMPVTVDLKALAIGRREDGSLWVVRLHGTHLLVAGATGAGKGLDHLGPDPRPLPRTTSRHRAAARRRSQADGTVLRPGDLRHLRPVRRRPGRNRRHARPGHRRHAGPRGAAGRQAA
jgi:S-DNA-T family DNA segregation ATPase FtsK/SpoIIIE